jgi:hypothetical protein
MRSRRSHRLRIPHALSCAVALFAQATLLPLLHGEHGGAAGLERALVVAHAESALPQGLHDDACVPPSHDAACRLCATLAGAGTALAADAAAMALPDRATTEPRRDDPLVAAPDIHRAPPRGPPALLS